MGGLINNLLGALGVSKDVEEEISLQEEMEALRIQSAQMRQQRMSVWKSSTVTSPLPPYPEASMLPYNLLMAANAVAEAEFALIGVKDAEQREKLEKKLQEAMAKYMAEKLAG